MRALEGVNHPQLPIHGTNSNNAKLGQDTIYLCNFRVSVDGDWLCLKELHDLDGQDSSAGATMKGRLAESSQQQQLQQQHHHRLMQSGGGIGGGSYRNSWNGTDGIAVGNTSDDLLVGGRYSKTVTNKRFSDSNWANFYCRCLGDVS